jgi:cytochrome c-type biogenesis protein CcmF
VAVGLTASNSYTRTQSFDMAPGETVSFAGHTFTYSGSEEFDKRESFGTRALVVIDGGREFAPALTTYKGRGSQVPTPSVQTGLDKDIYLTLGLPGPETASDPATITVSIKPMVVWLWIGGLFMAIGTVLAAFPGRRRRATDPVSAPISTGETVAANV